MPRLQSNPTTAAPTSGQGAKHSLEHSRTSGLAGGAAGVAGAFHQCAKLTPAFAELRSDSNMSPRSRIFRFRSATSGTCAVGSCVTKDSTNECSGVTAGSPCRCSDIRSVPNFSDSNMDFAKLAAISKRAEPGNNSNVSTKRRCRALWPEASSRGLHPAANKTFADSMRPPARHSTMGECAPELAGPITSAPFATRNRKVSAREKVPWFNDTSLHLAKWTRPVGGKVAFFPGAGGGSGFAFALISALLVTSNRTRSVLPCRNANIRGVTPSPSRASSTALCSNNSPAMPTVTCSVFTKIASISSVGKATRDT
mmetsp:Transcript_19060/g.41094  ORF Transcript_19060/g.41094 Transcript_19060/m.41094 type:complete len:312 (-) Transcript_19060:1602-2537(-)